jgi:hypothetical protein
MVGLQALIFDSSLVWGRSNVSMIAPTMGHMGKAYALFTPLGCIFMGAVLFNGNVENRGAAYLSELLPNL